MDPTANVRVADDSRRRSAAEPPERTHDLEGDLEDVPTANLDDASYEEATANVESDRPAQPVQREYAASSAPLTPSENHPAAMHTHSPPSRPPPVREVTTGSLLCNRYLLGRLLGAGGSALIFQAEDRRRIGAENFGSRIAVKVLRPEARHNAHALTRLKREFRQMQRLDHRGIARVYELERDEDVWFITMELIEGQTVNQWLGSEFVDRTDALAIIDGCCDALAHAHDRGVVHGDLKPSNVLVLADGSVKLVDFGSAAERDATTGEVDKDRSFAATPPYASPQVLAGAIADPRDDVFSLACLAYAVLTQGEHPFERKSSADALHAQMRPAYSRKLHPREFDAIVRGLAWERDLRPASVRDFLHALLASDLRLDANIETSSKPITVPVSDLFAASIPAPSVVQEQPMNAAHSLDMIEARGMPQPAPRGVVTDAWVYASARDAPARLSTTLQGVRMTRWRRSALLLALALFGAAVFLASESELEQDSAPSETVPTVTAPERAQGEPTAPVAPAEAVPGPPAQAPAAPAQQKKSTATVVNPAPAIAPGEISFATRTLHVGAGQTIAALMVKRLNSTEGRARVLWTIEGGTARRGVDYQFSDAEVIEFLDGQSIRSLFIPLLPERRPEQARTSRTFTVKLRQAAGGPALGEIKQVHVTIVGDPGERIASSSDRL